MHLVATIIVATWIGSEAAVSRGLVPLFVAVFLLPTVRTLAVIAAVATIARWVL